MALQIASPQRPPAKHYRIAVPRAQRVNYWGAAMGARIEYDLVSGRYQIVNDREAVQAPSHAPTAKVRPGASAEYGIEELKRLIAECFIV